MGAEGNEKIEELRRFRTSMMYTVLIVAAAGFFGAGIWVVKGQRSGIEFIAGYLVEQSLSVDNLFVFLMVFNYFQVPLESQGRVLTWGIIGAILMRGVMIAIGVAAIQRFRSVILIFAAILFVSGIKLFFETDEAEDLSKNMVMKFSKYCTGAVDEYDGEKFITVVNNRRRATPLLLCLVCIELSDFVFAVDSIPAVIGVSQDALVVYSSNLFAIMGLRSLYTLVAKAVEDLAYLRPAVALVLCFISVKMVLEFFHFEIPIHLSLLVVAGLLGGGILLSLCRGHAPKEKVGEDELHTNTTGCCSQSMPSCCRSWRHVPAIPA